MFEDTKEEIRNRKTNKERQFNGQMKKDKTTNNKLENTTQKTIDRATRISQNVERTQVILLHQWYPSCYSCYIPSINS